MFPASALAKIASSLSHLPGVSEEVKKQVLGLVGGQLHKLDLVTREEFEVQRKTLEKTREIIAELEKRVEKLEQRESIK